MPTASLHDMSNKLTKNARLARRVNSLSLVDKSAGFELIN